MTLILDPVIGFDILKMKLRIRNKVLGQGFQKLEPEQNRHTDRRDQMHYHAALAGGK